MTTQQQDRLRAGSQSFSTTATYIVAKYTTIGALATKNIAIGLSKGIASGIAEQARQRRLAQQQADQQAATPPLGLPEPITMTKADILEAIEQLKSML
jgi:hypothetical protein